MDQKGNLDHIVKWLFETVGRSKKTSFQNQSLHEQWKSAHYMSMIEKQDKDSSDSQKNLDFYGSRTSPCSSL